MRDELEYVVVETYDHARAGVSLLRNEVGARHILCRLPAQSETRRIRAHYGFSMKDGVISGSISGGIPRSTWAGCQAVPSRACALVI